MENGSVNAENFLSKLLKSNEVSKLKSQLNGSSVILMYSISSRNILKTVKATIINRKLRIYLLDKIYIIPYLAGSSNIAFLLEILKFFNVKLIIQLGLAGAINNNIKIGDIFISEGAFSESSLPFLFKNNFYYNNSLEICYSIDYMYKPSKELNTSIKNLFLSNNIKFKSGYVFTTDFLFGESIEKFEVINKNLKMKNIPDFSVIEMETATIFSFCNINKLKASSILLISDKITRNNWEIEINSPIIFNNYIKLIKLFSKSKFKFI